MTEVMQNTIEEPQTQQTQQPEVQASSKEASTSDMKLETLEEFRNAVDKGYVESQKLIGTKGNATPPPTDISGYEHFSHQ